MTWPVYMMRGDTFSLTSGDKINIRFTVAEKTLSFHSMDDVLNFLANSREKRFVMVDCGKVKRFHGLAWTPRARQQIRKGLRPSLLP